MTLQAGARYETAEAPEGSVTIRASKNIVRRGPVGVGATTTTAVSESGATVTSVGVEAGVGGPRPNTRNAAGVSGSVTTTTTCNGPRCAQPQPVP